MPYQALKTLITQGYKVFDLKNIDNHKQNDIKIISELEHNILTQKIKADCVVDGKAENTSLILLSNVSSNFESTKEVIKQQNIKEILENYLESEALEIRQEVFWRNPGGLPITPHQDICNLKQKHLSVEQGALQYTISDESKKYEHEFSISQHQYYAKKIGNKKFIVPYNKDQIIIHTPTSLHKARNPKKSGERSIYLRLIVYRSKAKQQFKLDNQTMIRVTYGEQTI